MEQRASRHGPLAEPVADAPVDTNVEGGFNAFRSVLGNRTYLLRFFVLVFMWFFAYVTVFGFSAGGTSLLTSLHYPPPEAGLINAVGAFGFLLCALVAVAQWTASVTSGAASACC
jgi:putative MFS transporter